MNTSKDNQEPQSNNANRVLGSVELQYFEVKEPKEIEYYQLFMKQPDMSIHERWFLCQHSTNYEWLKEQEKWWRSQKGYENNEFKIFSIVLPY